MSDKLSEDDRALEALIAMALRLEDNREITEEDIAEENLPELTEEERELSSKRGSQILRNVLGKGAKDALEGR